MSALEIDPADLAERGIAPAEVERQLALFRDPPGYAELVRCCSLGDGIEVIDDEAACLAAYERARAAGRLSKFVPASGAATRMFQALLACRDDELSLQELDRRAAAGDGKARLGAAFARGIDRLPFAEALEREIRRRGFDLAERLEVGSLAPIIDALIDEDGLDFANQPKGLLPFHSYEGGARTAFEEHLREAVVLVRDDIGRTRLHFTVSPEHVAAFQAELERVRPGIESDEEAVLEVGFSTQSPSTDTVAVDLQNRPLRDADGRIVFRPGGHGALLENLGGFGGDIALVQNIDNVQPESARRNSVRWKKLLIGRLVQLEEERAAACASGDEARRRDLAEALGVASLDDALDRPLRACGAVRNTGEPGGGPFWVRSESGDVTRQIVEGAQVDPSSEKQQKIFRNATHFNPAVLACSLRDPDDRPYDLSRFVDPRAVFIARKSFEGRDLKALERPGLWNGSMAGWGSVFVEIGDETFTPVKTVVDLLRPEHQPGPGGGGSR
jgi:hypothetical protein